MSTEGRESYLTLLAFHEREAMESIIKAVCFLATLFFVVLWFREVR